MGKTGTLLADWELLRRKGLAHTLIVVCPNSLKYAWEDAIKNEWKVDADVYVYEAAKRKYAAGFFVANKHRPKIFIVNYI